MFLLLTILIVFALLVVNEVWWRTHKTHNEFSRKFVHITVGSFVAFWPFFLPWNQIEFLSIAFVVTVLLSKSLNVFTAIHSSQRPTWGEVCFALAVGIVALATHDKWIYMAALLQMSLADGLAALIGTTFGKRSRYTFLGHTKSVVGTLTFFVMSVLILLVYSHFSGVHLTAFFIVGLATAASLIENVSVRGTDNLIVPVLIALFLAAQ